MLTKLLRVNSKYRTPNSASCTDFSVSLDSRDCENISQCVLLSATIPRQFGNVYAPNNVLRGQYSTTPLNPFNSFLPVAFQISEGVYTAVQLAVELTRVISAEFAFIRVEFNELRQRMHFIATNVPADFALNLSHESGLGRIVGITSNVFFVDSFSPDAYVDSPPALQGPTQIYVESIFIGNRACLDVLENGFSIPLVNVVPCALVPEGFNVNYQATNVDSWSISYDVESTGLANLRTVDIRICDEYGDVLSIPENQHVDLVFRVSKPT